MPGRPGFNGLVFVTEPRAFEKFEGLMRGQSFGHSGTHLKRVYNCDEVAAVKVYQEGGSQGRFMLMHDLPQMPLRWVL
jgi:hypothetical protein